MSSILSGVDYWTPFIINGGGLLLVLGHGVGEMGWGCVWSNKVGCLGVWVIIIIRGPFGYLFTQGPTLQLSESRGAGFVTFPHLL